VPRTAADQENGAGQDDADASSADSQQPEELHTVDSASRQRAQVPHRPAKRRVHGRRYYTWAELGSGVFMGGVSGEMLGEVAVKRAG
jgi:hypothetical protein